MVVNVFLFDDFEVMDAFGPVEILGRVPEHFYVRFISLRGGLITGKQEIKIWTEPLNPVEIEDIFLIPGGNDQNRNLIPLPQAAQHLDTVHIRQPQIQQNQVGLHGVGQRQRLTAASRAKRHIMVGGEDGFYYMGDGIFILYNQNFILRHRMLPPPKAK